MVDRERNSVNEIKQLNKCRVKNLERGHDQFVANDTERRGFLLGAFAAGMLMNQHPPEFLMLVAKEEYPELAWSLFSYARNAGLPIKDWKGLGDELLKVSKEWEEKLKNSGLHLIDA